MSPKTQRFRDNLLTILVTAAVSALARGAWDDVQMYERIDRLDMRLSQQTAIMDVRLTNVEHTLSQISRAQVIVPTP